MDKAAAARFLGVTPRTVENYAKSGKLTVTYISCKNGKRADYKELELERLKEGLKTPVHRAVVDDIPEDLEVINDSVLTDTSGAFEGLATIPPPLMRILEEIAAQVWLSQGSKLVLDLGEAAAASGYSKSHLRGAIAGGHLRAKKVGRGWKIRPQDLQRYTKWIFEGGYENGKTPVEGLLVPTTQRQETA